MEQVHLHQGCLQGTTAIIDNVSLSELSPFDLPAVDFNRFSLRSIFAPAFTAIVAYWVPELTVVVND